MQASLAVDEVVGRVLPVQPVEFAPGLGGVGEALAGQRIGPVAAIMGKARMLHRQRLRLHETLEMQMIDRGAGAVAVVAEAQAGHAGLRADIPSPAVQFRREELRRLAQRFGRQQAVQAGKGKLVVEDAGRPAGQFALPEDFLGKKRFVEMEARRIERAPQAVEFHPADAGRAQGA